jgi:hypothetical protein
VEAADEVLAGGEVDAGFAAEGGVDLGEDGGGDADVADTAHVDGGEEAGEVADDAATESEQDGVSVGAGVVELVSEGFDLGEALVGLAGGVEEDDGLSILGEAGEEVFVPEGPDVGRGDDEGARWLAGVELAQAGVEGAEKAWSDVDVVSSLRGGDSNGGHGEFMVRDRQRAKAKTKANAGGRGCAQNDKHVTAGACCGASLEGCVLWIFL